MENSGRVFHAMEKRWAGFPRHGKSRRRGATLGKVMSALLLAAAPAAAARLVEGFAPPTAATWQPFLQSPPAQPAAGGGLRFPLPFSREVDRAAWDKAVTLNLAEAVAFELEVSCPLPEAVRSLSLYFKSGNGWYVASKSLAGPAPHALIFLKSDFSTEGTPGGWQAISGIRLSPWKGPLAKDTALTVRRLMAVEGRQLAVVQGTSSCPDADTRAVAQKTAERISRMLVEAGLGHTRLTDDDLSKGGLAGTTVALLPYNPHPTPAQLKALNDFLARGGKLGVFYSASPALASALGFQLEAYVKAERPDRWRSIVFADPAEWVVPPRIWQNSPNLMPALPAAKGSRIVAFWENARGVQQPEPAIVVSPRGFWMSHIVMTDDWPSKKEMLVALCAQLDPTLWEPAARKAAQEAGRINDYAGLDHAVREINRQLALAIRPAEVRGWLDEALLLAAKIPSALAAGRAKDALQAARRQRNLLLRADAAVQPPRPGEFIGVWDHDGLGLVPGDWPATAAFLSVHGVNAIFPNLVWGGLAHYPSQHLPGSLSLRLYGDQLAAALAAAKARRMQLHVWYVLWKLDGAPVEFTERLKKEGRLQITESGATRPWLSPHHPANRRLVLDVVTELARQYPGIDGIHLDYIRLPDSLSCYSPTTRARFEAATGRKCRAWPAEVKSGGARHAEFRRWRTGDITAMVAEIRAALRRANPHIKLSAAVWGQTAPDGRTIGQYWPDWLKAGTVDFLVPMNYTESSAEFAALVRSQLAYPGAIGRIYPGIGVTADESRLDPAQVARQIVLARQAGCSGYVLFSLGGTLREETLPALRQGLTRPIESAP